MTEHIKMPAVTPIVNRGEILRRVDEAYPRSQANPGKMEEVATALKETQDRLKEFESKGYSLSAKFLRHYLGRSGKPLKLAAEDMDRSSLYRHGIETNNRRFEDSLTKGYVDGEMRNPHKQSPFKKKILNLKNGQTINLDNPNVKDAGDAWDRDMKRVSSLASNPDHGLALGAVKLRSLGNLRAKRHGNKVKITGEVYHTVKDVYDFNQDTYLDRKALKDYRLLAEQGRARPFQVYGSKPQKVTGMLEIKNGSIGRSHFRWEDIEE